ncbi:MAG: hypothetical protein ACI4QT_06735 [Kiritimatiellia bacterium]
MHTPPPKGPNLFFPILAIVAIVILLLLQRNLSLLIGQDRETEPTAQPGQAATATP